MPHLPVNSHDVHAMEVSQGIVLEATATVDGSVHAMEVDDEDEDGTSTDLEATTEAVPATEAVRAPAPEAVPAPAPEAVPAPETALALVIIIPTITCLLVSMTTINLTYDVLLTTDY